MCTESRGEKGLTSWILSELNVYKSEHEHCQAITFHRLPALVLDIIGGPFQASFKPANLLTARRASSVDPDPHMPST